MARLQPHPLAEIFPLIEGDAFDEMVEDIRERGIVDRIEMFDGQILDGRNRYNALVTLVESGEVLGLGWGFRAGEPLNEDHLAPDNAWFHRFNREIDGDPLPWVLSKNLQRRHLNEGQRAMVAAKLANMNVGRPRKVGNEPVEPHIPSIDGISARAAAQIMSVGTASVERARNVLRSGAPELQYAAEQGHVSVTAADKISRLPAERQSEEVARILPRGHRAIMGSRIEPEDSLDYFPTPPWATRALFQHVIFDAIGSVHEAIAWEPACGEGHIAEVLAEYFPQVIASDIHDYGYGQVCDYLAETAAISADWIITNPPFGALTERFVLKALSDAGRGVAMFVRMQWLETVGRYETIFRDYPPTVIAFFAERVPLCKGRWNPDGDTATAYVWLVWDKRSEPQPPIWIPPVCRKSLTKDDDVARFTASPVTKIPHHIHFVGRGKPSCAVPATMSVAASASSEAAAAKTVTNPNAGETATVMPTSSIGAAAAADVSSATAPFDIPQFLPVRNEVAAV